MKTPPASLIPSVLVAVELRASGASWPAVGEQVHRSAEACRKWPREYAAFWDNAFRAAEDRLIGEAGAEALFTLRQLLRAKDEWVKKDVARFLVQVRADIRKLDRSAAANAAPTDPDQDLTHAEAHALLDELGPAGRQARGALPAGPLDHVGP